MKAQATAHVPGVVDYRLHRIDSARGGLWPEIAEVATLLPPEAPDAVAEFTFGRASIARSRAFSRAIGAEADCFATIERSETAFRWVRGAYDRAGGRARAIVLLRRDESVRPERFRHFLLRAFVPELALGERTLELSVQFASGGGSLAAGYAAAVFVGATDVATLGDVFDRLAAGPIAGAQRRICAAIHAYAIRETTALALAGRPALPQFAALQPRPRLEPRRLPTA